MVCDGVKVLEIVPKRADISDERFHYFWAMLHPRVSHRVEPMKRYVQHHRITPSVPGLPPTQTEGITEAWFESMEGAHSAFNHPVFVSEGPPSMRRFMDLERSSWIFFTEELLLPGGGEGHPTVRAILHLSRRADLNEREFDNALRRHGERAARLEGLQRYSQLFAIRGAGSEGAFHEAAEIYSFEDLEVLEQVWSDDAVQRELLGDLATFCEVSTCSVFVAQAYRVK